MFIAYDTLGMIHIRDTGFYYIPLKSIGFCSSLQLNYWVTNLSLRSLLLQNFHKCEEFVRTCLFKFSPLHQAKFFKGLGLCF